MEMKMKKIWVTKAYIELKHIPKNVEEEKNICLG